MIVRVWTYQVKKEDANRFEDFEKRKGIPMMQEQAGCLGVEMLRPLTEGDFLPYVLLSRWQTWEQLQSALVSPTWKEEVKIFLAQGFGEGNGTITHFEVV